jgi:hypothetical protein
MSQGSRSSNPGLKLANAFGVIKLDHLTSAEVAQLNLSQIVTGSEKHRDLAFGPYVLLKSIPTIFIATVKKPITLKCQIGISNSSELSSTRFDN